MWFWVRVAPRKVCLLPKNAALSRQRDIEGRHTCSHDRAPSEPPCRRDQRITDDAEWRRSREAACTHALVVLPLPSPPSQQSVLAHKACTWGKGRERKRSTWRERARYPFSFFLPFTLWKKVRAENQIFFFLAFVSNVIVMYHCLGPNSGIRKRSILPAITWHIHAKSCRQLASTSWMHELKTLANFKLEWKYYCGGSKWSKMQHLCQECSSQRQEDKK